MPTVKKRDNMKERFSDCKIKRSVIEAANDANITEDRSKIIANEIASLITKKAKQEHELTSKTIRGDVLRELDRIEPLISRAWRIYDRQVKMRNTP